MYYVLLNKMLQFHRIFSLLMVLTSLVAATPVDQKHGGKRLIKFNEEEPVVWMSKEEILELKTRACPEPGRNFVDITNNPEFSLKNLPEADTRGIPTEPRFQDQVNQAIFKANRSRVEEFVRHFSEDYYTRYYESEGGEECQKWLYAEVLSILKGYSGEGSSAEIKHEWRQKSVIARLEGQDPTLREERVIIGAHIDSRVFPGNGDRAPGADDDATGSAVLLETLRLLVGQNMTLRRTLEFHWYAAEEMGLLGSMDIARQYRNANVKVAGMLQFDVVGFQEENSSHIGIYTDENGVNAEVAQFARRLTDEYLEFGWRDRICGYACSDHVPWTVQGYPAAFVGEFEWNDEFCEYHHTSNDTIDLVSFTQVMEFVKIATGFVVELGEPIV